MVTVNITAHFYARAFVSAALPVMPLDLFLLIHSGVFARLSLIDSHNQNKNNNMIDQYE